VAKFAPIQKPGRSEQSVGTDPKFIAAVVRRFGPLVIDLAASHENAQAPNYLTEEDDSFAHDWSAPTWPRGNRWLNPPFSHIAPWALKCAEYACARDIVDANSPLLFLVPAGVGANWFRDHVADKARVLFLNGRLTFVGYNHPYPKDCMLCIYGDAPGYEVWSWQQ